jgi:hypothetical protein
MTYLHFSSLFQQFKDVPSSKSRHDSPSASLGPIPAFETRLTQASNEAILLHTIFLDLVETVTNYPLVK